MAKLPSFLGQATVPQSPLVFVPRDTDNRASMTPAAAKSAAKSLLRKAGTERKAAAAAKALLNFDDDDDDAGADICSICLLPCEHLEKGEPTAVLECGHVYHVECWKGWAERDNATCPLCRSTLAVHQSFGLSPVHGLQSPVAGATPRRQSQGTPLGAPHVEDENASPNKMAQNAPTLETQSYRELQKLAKACGLRATGKREALLAALRAHQAAGNSFGI